MMVGELAVTVAAVAGCGKLSRDTREREHCNGLTERERERDANMVEASRGWRRRAEGDGGVAVSASFVSAMCSLSPSWQLLCV